MQTNYYEGLANELVAKVGRLTNFVSHGPSIGVYHEEVLKSVLAPLLPSRYSLRTGFLFDPEFGASNQGDILIVDEHQPTAYYFHEGNFAVVDSRALVCVIEVKTRLNKRTFLESINCLASFQRVARPPHRPLTYIFAFESAAFTPPRLHQWYSAVEVADQVENYPMAIFALNAGLVQLAATYDQLGHMFLTGEPKRGPKVQSLSVFLSHIRKSIEMTGGVKRNTYEMALLGELRRTVDRFYFGKGHVVLPAA